jgi:hypothetical protein
MRIQLLPKSPGDDDRVDEKSAHVVVVIEKDRRQVDGQRADRAQVPGAGKIGQQRDRVQPSMNQMMYLAVLR